MISSISWVPRGAAARTPIKYEFSPEELEQIRKAKADEEARLQKQQPQQGERRDGAAPKTGKGGVELDRLGLPADLRMEDYGEDHDEFLWENQDDDDEDSGEDEEATLARELAEKNAANGEGLGDLEDDEDGDEEEGDMGDDDDDDDDEDDDEEEGSDDEQQMMDDVNMDDLLEEGIDEDEVGSDAEDFEVKPTDQLIVVANSDEEFCNLEVYLYDDEAGSMYVHHDIPLPAFPLTTTWIGCGKEVFGAAATTDAKNYIGVGTFKPEIEIWNLDVLDALEPTLVLGDGKGQGEAHTDAVMGLDWNCAHHHLLASGSADHTVKLWDMNKAACVQTFRHHKDKVQAAVWNPVEASVLLTGSFDQSLSVFDAKAAQTQVLEMKLTSDVESCMWNPHRPEQVLASTEDGRVSCFDVRNAGAGPVFSFQAHAGKPCSAISASSLARGLLATCSPDKSVKLWDLEGLPGPRCIGEKIMSVGALFDVAFDVDAPFMLAAGGKGALALWDVAEETEVERIFKSRMVSKRAGPAAAAAAAAVAAADAAECASADASSATGAPSISQPEAEDHASAAADAKLGGEAAPAKAAATKKKKRKGKKKGGKKR